MRLNRRKFLGGVAGMGAGLLVERAGLLTYSSQAADSRIGVLTGEEIGTINPDVYGHFAEHLGGVVYDGIWVGENSKVPRRGSAAQSKFPESCGLCPLSNSKLNGAAKPPLTSGGKAALNGAKSTFRAKPGQAGQR